MRFRTTSLPVLTRIRQANGRSRFIRNMPISGDKKFPNLIRDNKSAMSFMRLHGWFALSGSDIFNGGVVIIEAWSDETGSLSFCMAAFVSYGQWFGLF